MAKEKKLNHLGLILDGNRRWAKEKGLPTFEGHKKGYEKIKKVGDWCLERDINILSAFVFSTENWKRTSDEVKYLMDLIALFLEKDVHELHEKGIKVIIAGRLEGLNKKMQKLVKQAHSLTKNNTKGTLQLCINYGGRIEIVDAVKKIVKSGISMEDINEEIISQHIYNPDIIDPDLIIRTSGEQRLSGFLTWQSVYSELLFLDKYWPDFSEEDLDSAIDNYENRGRRYGK